MPTTRDRSKQDTQERVLDAAARLFREHGFTATTIRDIAESSGVSSGSVMAAGDKSDLLVRVFDTLIEAEHLHRAASDPPPGEAETCVDRLMALVRPFVAVFIGHQALARAYASVLVSGDHASTLFTDLAIRLVDEFGTAITVHGCTSSTDAASKARALYLAYVGILFTWSAKGPAAPTDLDDVFRDAFTAICTCEEQA